MKDPHPFWQRRAARHEVCGLGPAAWARRATSAIRAGGILATLLVVTGCSTVRLAVALPRYERQLVTVRGDPNGEHLVRLESDFDATIRKYVAEHGPPDYVFVADMDNVAFIYIDRDVVAHFNQSIPGHRVDSLLTESQGVPSELSARFAHPDQDRLVHARQNQAPPPPPASGAVATGPPVGTTTKDSAGQPPMARNSVEDTKAVAVLRVFLRTHPHGHDIEAVYERLTQRNKDSAEKREFETSEEYRRRLATISARPVIGSLIIEDLFAFEVPLSDPVHPSSLTYDADVGVMRAGIHFEQMLFSEGPSGAGPGHGGYRLLPSKDRVVNMAPYVGSNAFGAKTVVERYRVYSYFIAITNLDEFDLTTPGASLDLAIAMDRGTARMVKDRLRAIAICRLSEPFTSDFLDHHKPTLDEPRESYYWRRHVYCALRELWICDPVTGKVLDRIEARRAAHG